MTTVTSIWVKVKQNLSDSVGVGTVVYNIESTAT